MPQRRGTWDCERKDLKEKVPSQEIQRRHPQKWILYLRCYRRTELTRLRGRCGERTASRVPTAKVSGGQGGAVWGLMNSMTRVQRARASGRSEAEKVGGARRVDKKPDPESKWGAVT